MLSGQNNDVENFIIDLVQEAEEYGRTSIPEHRKEIKKEVKSLLNQGLSIHTRDKYGRNAAYYLGMLKNKQACLFLWEQGADYFDFIRGAFFASKDSLPFVEEFINNMPKDFVLDYNLLANVVVRYGYQQAAQKFLAKIPSPHQPNYYLVAMNAASGGHQKVAEYFLSKIKEPQILDYNDLAVSAAMGGHRQIAEYFLSKITPPEKPDYDRIIKAAEKRNQTAVAQHFIALAQREIANLANKNADSFVKSLVGCVKEYVMASSHEKKRNIQQQINMLLEQNFSIHAKDNKGLNAAMHLSMGNNKKACFFLVNIGAAFIDIVEGAFKGNHLALVNDLLDNPPTGFEVNYNLIAAFAAKYGHQNLAENFLSKIGSQKPDYNFVAYGAALGGHQNVADYFLSKIKAPERPEYMNVAIGAAHGGHQTMADYYLYKMLASEKPDYNLLAAAAAQGGFQQVADYYLGKIITPEKPDYNRVAGCAARCGHQQLAENYLAKITRPEKPDYSRVASCAWLGGYSQVARYFVEKLKVEQELEKKATDAAAGLLAICADPVIHSTNQATIFPSANSLLGDISNTITSKPLAPQHSSLQKQIEIAKERIAMLRKLLDEKDGADELTTAMSSSKSVTLAANSKCRSSMNKAPGDGAALLIHSKARHVQFK